jgi:predicted nucleic acid-binding protein
MKELFLRIDNLIINKNQLKAIIINPSGYQDNCLKFVFSGKFHYVMSFENKNEMENILMENFFQNNEIS